MSLGFTARTCVLRPITTGSGVGSEARAAADAEGSEHGCKKAPIDDFTPGEG